MISPERVEAVAKWAGFKKADEPFWDDTGKRFIQWQYPDGRWMVLLPNFPLNVAACEKWILPKVESVSLVLLPEKKWASCVLLRGDKRGTGVSETLAGAIFLAVEQLMKAEEEDAKTVS